MNHLDIYHNLRYMPIAINNYYGDPTLQWDNTLWKVGRLNSDAHRSCWDIDEGVYK